MNQAYKCIYPNKGASGVSEITVEKLKSYLREHKEELCSQLASVSTPHKQPYELKSKKEMLKCVN